MCNAFGVLGAVVGFVAFFIAYRSIRRRHAKAMQELHDLSDDIAHDLRTPLARMHAQAELAAMGEVSAQELAAGVAEETTSMLELINTMLDLSQTGARIERSPRTDVDLAAIVRQMTEFYASVAEDKRVAFVLDLPEGEIVRSAHKAKLQQLVGNLLDNAVKFTPAGGTVSVTLSKESETGLARLAVSDTGIGISEEDQPNLFKRFWRSDASRSLPGNGLGLAVVKAIVTSYGGSVTCTSHPGVGTTFVVKL
ncbi:MAG: HAMP domain-containing histidine kinase [Kiritimatiellae bacterium]|nr:HAMP domain-containing histidine kinase [Kiritimatiellia bacterium]